MTDRVLVALGCNSYEHLSPLASAESDAQSVYAALVDSEYGTYSETRSEVLMSPTRQEVLECLQRALFGEPVDVFTLHFAGHGGVKAGSYYLCTRDSHHERLSATALPLTQLFAILNEASVKQVNLILDSCQAGGLVHDLHAALKPEIIGNQASVAISMLAASASDQSASEDDRGGLLTQHLIRSLMGEIAVQSSRPYLDLVEIGRNISAGFEREMLDQVPIVWGLNLYGDGIFAANPHFSESATKVASAFAEIPPASELGTKIEPYSDDLWEAYLSLTKGFDCRVVADVIDRVAEHLASQGTQVSRFVHGVAGTFAERADGAPDPAARSLILATASTSLLRFHDASKPDPLLIDLVNQTQRAIANLLIDTASTLDSDRFALLSRARTAGGLADLYFLPIRISRLLAFAITAMLVDKLQRRNAMDDNAALALMRKVVDLYPSAFRLVSDSQAPYVYIIGRGLALLDQTDLGRQVLDRYFLDLASFGGIVASADIEKSNIFHFLLMRHSRTYVLDSRILANPSNLTGAVFAAGVSLGVGADWNSHFRQMDRHQGSLFVCHDHRKFADKTIRSGTNEAFIIGFGVWTLDDFEEIFDTRCRAVLLKDRSLTDALTHVLSIISSLLYPDRVPYNLECLSLAEN